MRGTGRKGPVTNATFLIQQTLTIVDIMLLGAPVKWGDVSAFSQWRLNHKNNLIYECLLSVCRVEHSVHPVVMLGQYILMYILMYTGLIQTNK